MLPVFSYVNVSVPASPSPQSGLPWPPSQFTFQVLIQAQSLPQSPLAPSSAGTDCFFCACPQIGLNPFDSAYPARYSTWPPLSWSLQGQECLVNYPCPAPHSFLNRTSVSAAWCNDWQPANWGSQPSVMFTFSRLLALRTESAAGTVLDSFQNRLGCGLRMAADSH